MTVYENEAITHVMETKFDKFRIVCSEEHPTLSPWFSVCTASEGYKEYKPDVEPVAFIIYYDETVSKFCRIFPLRTNTYNQELVDGVKADFYDGIIRFDSMVSQINYPEIVFTKLKRKDKEDANH